MTSSDPPQDLPNAAPDIVIGGTAWRAKERIAGRRQTALV
jgi:hypothetical protein